MNVRYILKNLSRLYKNFGLRAMIEVGLIPPHKARCAWKDGGYACQTS